MVVLEGCRCLSVGVDLKLIKNKIRRITKNQEHIALWFGTFYHPVKVLS